MALITCSPSMELGVHAPCPRLAPCCMWPASRRLCDDFAHSPPLHGMHPDRIPPHCFPTAHMCTLPPSARAVSLAHTSLNLHSSQDDLLPQAGMIWPLPSRSWGRTKRSACACWGDELGRCGEGPASWAPGNARGGRALKGREYSRCACLSASRRFASNDFSSATMASSLWERATCHIGRSEVISLQSAGYQWSSACNQLVIIRQPDGNQKAIRRQSECNQKPRVRGERHRGRAPPADRLRPRCSTGRPIPASSPRGIWVGEASARTARA